MNKYMPFRVEVKTYTVQELFTKMVKELPKNDNNDCYKSSAK